MEEREATDEVFNFIDNAGRTVTQVCFQVKSRMVYERHIHFIRNTWNV